MKTRNIVLLVLMIGLIAGAASALIYAQYVMTSNSVTVTVTQQATLALTVNGAASLTSAQGNLPTITLTATCSDASFSGTVTFLQGAAGSGTSIGTATAVNGVATLTSWQPSSTGTFNVYATASHN